MLNPQSGPTTKREERREDFYHTYQGGKEGEKRM